MRSILFVFIAGFVPVLCGTPFGDGELTAEKFSRRAQVLVCELLDSCPEFAMPFDQCMDDSLGFQEAVECDFDSTNGNLCLNELEAATCDDLLSGSALAPCAQLCL